MTAPLEECHCSEYKSFIKLDREAKFNTRRTSTMSVNSSIYTFVEENGRTYHKYKEGSMLSRYVYSKDN
jgi:hypothetical protein